MNFGTQTENQNQHVFSQHNVCYKKIWTSYNTVSLLWFVQIFLKQTLISSFSLYVTAVLQPADSRQLLFYRLGSSWIVLCSMIHCLDISWTLKKYLRHEIYECVFKNYLNPFCWVFVNKAKTIFVSKTHTFKQEWQMFSSLFLT